MTTTNQGAAGGDAQTIAAIEVACVDGGTTQNTFATMTAESSRA